MAVRYEPQGKVAYITLDRPDALNTFDRAMHIELHDAWSAFRDDPELWVAVVTGAGDRAFSADPRPSTGVGPMYSSARFIPPTMAHRSSTTTILRWLRRLAWPRKGTWRIGMK